MEMEKEEFVKWQLELEESRFPNGVNGDPGQSNGVGAHDDVIDGADPETSDFQNKPSSSVYYDPNEETRLSSTHSVEDRVGAIPGNGILEIGTGDVHVPKNFVSVLGSQDDVNKKVLNSLRFQQSEIVSEEDKNEDDDLINGGVLEETEVDLEKVIQKQNTHDLFCPNCNSCITRRVILRKRKRGIRIPDEDVKRNKVEGAAVNSSDTQETVENENDRDEVFRCLSCFSFFIPSGNGFKIFRGSGSKDQQRPVRKNWISSMFGSREEPISEPGDIPKEVVNDSPASTSNILVPDIVPVFNGQLPKATQNSTLNVPKDDSNGHQSQASTSNIPVPDLVPVINGHQSQASTSNIHVPDLVPVINGQLPKETQNSTVNVPKNDSSGHQSVILGASTDRIPVNGKSPENVVSIPPDGLKLLIASNGSSPSTGQNPDMMIQNSDKGEPDSSENSQQTNIADGTYAGQLLTNKDPLVLSSKDVQFVQGGQVDMIKDLGKVSENLTEGRDTIIVVEPEEVHEMGPQPSENLNVSGETGISTSLIPSVSAYEQGRADGRESYRVDIIKSIVYGGLVESIASLGIVSAAAGGGSDALNIVTLSLANLMGGLVLIYHNLRDLKKDQLSEQQRRRQLPDRYEELLGRREGFLLHATVAMLSFLIFGLIPPITYGLSFRKSYSTAPELKIFATAAAAFGCILVLAFGKAYVQRAPKPYPKTVSYFILMGFMVSGISYGAGILIDRILHDKLHFRSNSDITLLQSTSTALDWASY